MHWAKYPYVHVYDFCGLCWLDAKRFCHQREVSIRHRKEVEFQSSCLCLTPSPSTFLLCSHAFANLNKGVRIQSRLGADLFNIKPFKYTSKTTQILIRNWYLRMTPLLSCIVQPTHRTLIFSSLVRANSIHKPAPGSTDSGEDMTIDWRSLEQICKFKYLGSTMSAINRLDAELLSRISLTSQAFGRLNQRVWHNKHLTIYYHMCCVSAVGAKALTVHKLQAE